VAAALLLVPSVAAQSATVATDGASLADQSAATQEQFQATWGTQAASQWVTEHNAVLGSADVPITVPAPAPGPSLAVVIDMNDKDQFAPPSLTIPRGASVTWTNSDADDHTITADPAKAFPGVKPTLPAGAAPFDSGDVGPGATYLHKFDVSGHYVYFCSIHAATGMIGTIDVT
jgi:plastocyanin